jgi:hypothetical protein
MTEGAERNGKEFFHFLREIAVARGEIGRDNWIAQGLGSNEFIIHPYSRAASIKVDALSAE